jgi:hypothetical protein
LTTLDFLEAADGTPLTKTFTLVDGSYDVAPYPHVRDFNSHRIQVADTREMYQAVVEQAAMQRCLLKGTLREPLKGESRMGMTDPTAPTNWSCIDNDFDKGWKNLEAFVEALDPNLADVDLIVHQSASSGITSEPGLRSHIYFQHTGSYLPAALKLWLRSRNFLIPELREQITLSANGLSLKYPLDVTTCQNDKLIYIAPPVCNGFEDPIGAARFEFIERERRTLGRIYTMNAMTPAQLEAEAQKLIEELRAAAGLKKKTARYKTTRGIEYLANPEAAAVTAIKQARGFYYLNLNGGDSWAYYVPEDNLEFVHNFKGEPIMRLRDLAPDFYRELRNAQVREKKSNRDFIPIVGRDRTRDNYFNLIFRPEANTVEYSRVSNVQKMEHFLRQYDEPVPEIIEDWVVEFDPTNLEIIDCKGKWLNTFAPTPYILNAKKYDNIEVPPQIARVIRSICGNDDECIRHFLNWLAHIFQTRCKTCTAWVFHGVSGTGKGLLLTKILKPLFGHMHVLEYTAAQLDDTFNAGLETAIILGIDEFHYESARTGGNVMNKLKNIITEDRLAIRAMRQDAIMLPNFTNVLIFSNHPDPVYLASHDRRFNVAPAQEVPLRMTEAEIEEIESEVRTFANFLWSFEVNQEDVRRILLNEARSRMIVASQTSIERVFEAFRMGDLQYFTEYVSMKMPMQDTLLFNEFAAVITDWARAAVSGDKCAVTIDEIKAVYHYIIGQPQSPAKLRRMLAVYRLQFEGGIQGISVQWGITPEVLDAFLERRSPKPETKGIKLARG